MMYKTLAIMALVNGLSAVDLKFAQGMGADEWNGETIKMKGPSKMESYEHVMIDNERLGNHEKKKYTRFLKFHDHPNSKAAKLDARHDAKIRAATKKHSLNQASPNLAKDDFAEGLTDKEHDFGTTIRMKEPEGLRPYHYAEQNDEFAEGLNDKEHDFQTTIRIKDPDALRQYRYISLDEEPASAAQTAGGAGALPRPNVPIRGEKEWQNWAQELVDHEDYLTDVANRRIPYASTVQLEEQNLVHIQNEDGEELIKIEESGKVPLGFRF